MKKTIFTGAAVAIVTPFNENGINFEELKRLIDFNIDNDTDAIVIAGTTGESSTMSNEEHKEAIRFTVKYVNKRIPVIAGTGSNDTAYAVELSKYAENVGVDGILVVTPYYNKATQGGLVKHFTYIADRVNVPMILYNVPSRTGVNILPETYVELAKHPRIVATKESSGDLSQVAKIKALCGDNLDIYSGNDDQIVPVLSLGGKGVISVLSNVMPKEAHEICSLYFEGMIEESTKMQTDYLKLINNLFIEVNPIPVKTALGLMGYNIGDLRMPLFAMEGENLETLKECLKEYKLI
ncbi:4-hydroxy-tetrahydrodipicolinate synthase [Clostridium saccharobutylicum]|uniref:4-hydroxy-tetrahydrodipicolinate synthase n=1 Tax=Clostridium saccharobutylicum DSM 13864 TaxID=1345695 RepID=U5MSM1_CLOSA|nr:4-hydroxy-tetrahydrodipicolinate synthase [Clostridium saccharobutylicum]AGX43508.1 4-hydroxy-tetrahydrodipicolinate synthase DapA [Clostridium saccharobutylicum DSM 13864]AQR90804.1 4-hydroxy-tetrahydrodipicolinate synthase [Clostridium saccharobutylicum]AQS00708.1 4-hydroxy-tetrahydrodipicolinate synthase [Clostridium saccharobutylicum]AQS10367.1 4-hydroxy-tetrahydrodipicolinate synthase [Clostridium saccharobutylicum]AQS14691.1 4-hydroxy-tetrahydrodipicolinate synthase [Clostridium sacch